MSDHPEELGVYPFWDAIEDRWSVEFLTKRTPFPVEAEEVE
jgi:hypothetical protein